MKYGVKGRANGVKEIVKYGVKNHVNKRVKKRVARCERYTPLHAGTP